QAAAIRQIVQDLLQRLARPAHQCRQRKRIEVADAVVVRQAALRTHAQTIGHRLAVPNRTERAAAAEMARDDPRLGIAEQLAGALGDVTMARAVKAPALDAVLLGPFERYRVVALAGRNG